MDFINVSWTKSTDCLLALSSNSKHWEITEVTCRRNFLCSVVFWVNYKPKPNLTDTFKSYYNLNNLPTHVGLAWSHQLVEASWCPGAPPAAGRTWSTSSSIVALIHHSSTEWSITINAWQREEALYSKKSVSLSNAHCWNSPVAWEMRWEWPIPRGRVYYVIYWTLGS